MLRICALSFLPILQCLPKVTKPVLSIVKATTDNVSIVHFYLILNNEVVASARISYPYEPMPVLMAGFVVEAHRGKGYWRWLYEDRITWLEQHNPKAKSVHLYVDSDNTMGGKYLAMGFEYTGEIETDNGCKWMRRKLD